MQEARSLLADFATDIDRLAKEVAQRKREEAAAASELYGASARSIDDIDADLDSAEGERARLEQSKEDLLRKQTRNKYVLLSIRVALLHPSRCHGQEEEWCIAIVWSMQPDILLWERFRVGMSSIVV